jgi:signal peptidase I
MSTISRRQVWEDVWSPAMEPAIAKGSHLIVDRYYYAMNPLTRWDIVVIAVNHQQIPYFPKRTIVEVPDFGQGAKKVEMIPNFCFVTRVLGLPGETISLNNGTVGFDHSQQELPQDLRHTFQGLEIQPKKIAENSFFTINDNWRLGVDSRHFGPIPTEFIVGKVVR